jgi:PhnB protein
MDSPLPAKPPRIVPYLYYRDVAAALEWLSRTFGFVERMRMPGPEGALVHAEMEIGDGLVMLGCPGDDYRNPRQLGGTTQGLYVYVDDVDRHFERAQKEGATILEEPGNQFYGDRRYTAEDPEGHQWFFAVQLRDAEPQPAAPIR